MDDLNNVKFEWNIESIWPLYCRVDMSYALFEHRSGPCIGLIHSWTETHWYSLKINLICFFCPNSPLNWWLTCSAFLCDHCSILSKNCTSNVEGNEIAWLYSFQSTTFFPPWHCRKYFCFISDETEFVFICGCHGRNVLSNYCFCLKGKKSIFVHRKVLWLKENKPHWR